MKLLKTIKKAFVWLKHSMLLIIPIIGLWAIIFSLMHYKDWKQSKDWFFLIFGYYCFFGFIFSKIKEHTSWKYKDIVVRVLFEFPLYFSGFLISFFIVNYGFVIILLLALNLLPQIIFNKSIELSTAIYISVTFGFVLNVYLNSKFKKIIIRVSGKDFAVKKIALKIYSKNMVLLYVYVFYFLVIMFTNIIRFSNVDFALWPLKANDIILQSLVTFIAVERVIKHYLKFQKK